MRLATWNINSVRLRINLVTDFLKSADIDVLCLQETKTEDAHFPSEAFAKAVPLIQQREVEAGKADGFSNPQIRVGPKITPVLQALEQRLQALATNATNEIPSLAADTAEPALATVAATPPAATPAARP